MRNIKRVHGETEEKVWPEPSAGSTGGWHRPGGMPLQQDQRPHPLDLPPVDDPGPHRRLRGCAADLPI